MQQARHYPYLEKRTLVQSIQSLGTIFLVAWFLPKYSKLLGWLKIMKPGTHAKIMFDPNVKILAEQLSICLAEPQSLTGVERSSTQQ